MPKPRTIQELAALLPGDPWLIGYLARGRDPDTMGDAVYRTTRFENPYISDPLGRAYGLGGIAASNGATIPAMLQAERWAAIDNDRTGQHADRPGAAGPCDVPDASAAADCPARGFLSDYWAGRTP
ncbi:MAG: hypothetical protein WDM81_02510 [Rhizomicrobium sp.]